MKVTLVRNGALAALALALAACAGNGTVPSGASNGMMAANALQRPVKNPCSTLANAWDFQGACKSQKLKPAGGVVELRRYQGIAVNLAFRKTDAKGMVPFLFGDATGNGDITGTYNGASFPTYGASCVNLSGASTPCTGTAFVYIEAVNTSQTAVNLTSSPRITVTNQKAYPGKSCSLAVLQSSGAWLITPIAATPKKHALDINSVSFPITLSPGGFYLTIACQ